MKLKGKIALITGGTSGIGKATALLFIQHGAQVIITGRNKHTIDSTVAELGHQAIGIVSDAGNMVDLMRLGEELRHYTTRLDIVFVNAGFGKYAPLELIDETHYEEMFNTIVKGTLFTVQQVLPLMSSDSAIVLNTSIVTEVGMQNSSVYSAAKAAVQSFTKTFASELISRGIRVNAISPGPIQTNYFDRSNLSKEQVESFTTSFAPQVPIQRFGQASEVAEAVMFLASDAASYIVGTELSVDGGFPKIKTS
ncbi:SDR family oxidoreductase [Myroides odoratimimus]|uniref:SDR family oxidoreductase n=1 Tax=Myroides TaxID=76831 RepID=UPI002180967E|nr:SDR family oxidoreductase [Myroides odoratimimus]MCS7473572.1 SDR family oxidoreductase [Myroides odoratimimus]MDM1413940.1 SDR family oxidoreductase [Myroides odoratimimus]MDM1446188.1 SDR family oxidoreductase [Myroides odoratimimus]MDM1508368.1 SDR family oxidoreductase [Myroides odoratimimus]MDM1519023.1 SDR family oxidoreductase [Myroides odoratimimus]